MTEETAEGEELRDAQVDAREDEASVQHLRRMLESAEQKAQRSRVLALKLAGQTADAFLAPPDLRPEDLERASVPRGSIFAKALARKAPLL